jgi:hypothetical protein
MCNSAARAIIPGVLAAVVLCTIGLPFAAAQEAGKEAARVDFIRGIDLETVRLIAVQHEGRFKTLDTLAREMISRISGRKPLTVAVEGAKPLEQDPLFTFLDVVFQPDAYHERPLIFVKKLPIRKRLVAAAEAGGVDKATLDTLLKDGRLSLSFLMTPQVRTELEELRRDVIRTSRDTDALVGAALMTRDGRLAENMRIVPPPGATSIQDGQVA